MTTHHERDRALIEAMESVTDCGLTDWEKRFVRHARRAVEKYGTLTTGKRQIAEDILRKVGKPLSRPYALWCKVPGKSWCVWERYETRLKRDRALEKLRERLSRHGWGFRSEKPEE